MHSDIVIDCQHLSHSYGKRQIYNDLSFSVPRGRILGLLGKNGTGKTTIINILSGYLAPSAGRCTIFGTDVRHMPHHMRRQIGLLIEGHVQYQFMNIEQIEHFYAPFFPGQWRRDAYYELMRKLRVAPRQRISRMSCGQRSQVALGLILAQNPELLVLDDFSLGLDPGYRRLFVDYLREYARAEQRTVFLTSHIIQDMERLIDDCIIMDYGRILVQQPVGVLLEQVRQYTCSVPEGYSPTPHQQLYHPTVSHGRLELTSPIPHQQVAQLLRADGINPDELQSHPLNLEDAFIGLTGKY
ncbi:MAG: ABC transporter ATP-binding protein [Bacteroidales bacterium]|nr:ABC transporter ATP-binding protein [Bacteroidales bacterium]